MNDKFDNLMRWFVHDYGFTLLKLSRRFGEMGTCFHCDNCSVHYTTFNGEWVTDIICWRDNYFGTRRNINWIAATEHSICREFRAR